MDSISVEKYIKEEMTSLYSEYHNELLEINILGYGMPIKSQTNLRTEEVITVYRISTLGQSHIIISVRDFV